MNNGLLYLFAGLCSLSSFSFSHLSLTSPFKSPGNVSMGILFCEQNCRQRIKRASYWPVSSEILLVTFGCSLLSAILWTSLALYRLNLRGAAGQDGRH